MQRRDFLITAAGGILATGASAEEKPKPKIVDSHIHFYDTDNLELDVNGGPAMPADVARLAERCAGACGSSSTSRAPNSCGLTKGELPRDWREGMQAAAKHPNVFCKVSALVEHTTKKPAPREVDFYRSVLDALWTFFGEERLIFGSNWPVSNGGAPYETFVGVVQDYFTAKGERAAAKFFFDNSQTAYAWRKR